MDRIKGDFKNKAGLDGADGAKAFGHVIADPAVYLRKLVIRKTRIGLADGDQLVAPDLHGPPSAERVV